MLSLSTRAKEAIKLGLTMVIVYGIGLRMGWPNPYWAAFAVAMISLPTAGQSLNKGAMRMLGTLVAGAAALTLVALAPQERWTFMALTSVYLAVCAYMATGEKHQYFWTVAGFVCLIIVISGPQPDTVFDRTWARVVETAMGITVYTLICVFLWPQTSEAELGAVSRKLLETQIQVYRAYREMMTGGAPGDGNATLETQEIQQLARLQELLDAAASERYEVRVLRQQWKRLVKLSTSLAATFEQWRAGFAETERIDMARVIPDLPALHAELDERFEQMARMLRGEPPERSPQTTAVTVDESETRDLSNFERAAVAVTQSQLMRLETLTRSLFECIEDLKGYRIHPAPRRLKPPLRERLVLDPDRAQGVVLVLAAFWAGFLIWVYLDPPGDSSWLYLPATVALVLAQTPYIKAWTVVVAFAVGIPIAGVLYVFVMPNLSGYAELATMLFCAFFVVNYLFWKPQQAFFKLGSNISIISLVTVENQQSYDFASFANSGAFTLMAVALIVAIQYVPFSPRPEKAFLRLLRRFFRSAGFLLSTMAYDSSGRPVQRPPRQTAFHRKQIATLPRTLRIWASGIDHRALPDTTPAQVQAIITELQAFSYRLQELHDTRTLSQSDIAVGELLEDMRAWRMALQTGLRGFVDDPAGEPLDEIKRRVESRMGTLESRVEETLALPEAEHLSDEERLNIYRALGGYRGLTEAGLAYAEVASGVNWSQWREARF